ncbi:MAG TPA: DUF4112 domain-containing protein [Clostridia bacterium]|nr:DUF4112 domain-containing protein [Clostridia bacterium]
MPVRGQRPTDGWLEGEERTERLRAAERRIALVSRVLDDLVEVPGTGRRFGLDPLIGFIPVIGDAASALVGLWLIAEAARFRLPRIVLARMVLNTLVDLLVGAVPLIGDVFDFVAKPNARNVALFRRYASDPASGTGDQRAFFAGLALIVAGILWLLVQAVGWLQTIEISIPGL